MVLAMAWTIFTGAGLVNLPTFDVIGPDATGVGASMLKGAAVGGTIGLLLGPVVLIWAQRRKARAMVANEDTISGVN